MTAPSTTVTIWYDTVSDEYIITDLTDSFDSASIEGEDERGRAEDEAQGIVDEVGGKFEHV